MNNLGTGLKSFLLTCAAAVTLTGFAAAAPASAQAADPATEFDLGVKIQINDELVHFPDAQPFIDDHHLTQVPVRFVSEKLGYQVQWTEEDGLTKVRITNPAGRRLDLKTGNPVAKVDGAEVRLDAAPSMQDGRVYVPLRFLMETAGIRIQWDPNNCIAILNEDGKYHAPAWYAPKLQLIDTFKASAYSADPRENGGYGAYDYFGNPLQVGTVAVDPSVIPLGTVLYVEGYHNDGLPAGGMIAKAVDTGGAIKGKRMDIFIPGSRQTALKFGFQQVKVYKLS